MSPLTQEQIDELLAQADKRKRPSVAFPPEGRLHTTLTPKQQEVRRNERRGPLRWYDNTLRCASKGCGSPTNCKVEGIPYCMMHALRSLNEMVIRMTEQRFEVVHGGTTPISSEADKIGL
jgi:hypothetical protein